MEIVLFLFLLIILGALVASKSRLPFETILILGSIIIGVVPGLPDVTFRPEIVFLVFLPPILFSAAYYTSWPDFRYNLRPILHLAIGLVLFTMCSVALAVKLLVPSLPWPHAFLLGAIVSPPDAAAATSLARKFGIPRRMVAILEGESLVNDATALTAYRFALAAVATGVFSLEEVSYKFAWVGVGGAAVGLVLGFIGVQLLPRFTDTRAGNVWSLLIAYGSYTLAENLGASGVISTVAAGLYFGRTVPRVTSAQSRVESKAINDSLIFAINGLVFTLIGLQLRSVILALEKYSWTQLIAFGLVVSVIVIGVRILWIYSVSLLPRVLPRKAAARSPDPPWWHLFLLSWTGMRGIVSLAAAMALPHDLLYRDLLVFLTYFVILATLLVPTLSLPVFIRRLGLHGRDEHYREEALARVTGTESVLEVIRRWEETQSYPFDFIRQFQDRFERRLKSVKSNLEDIGYTELVQEDVILRRMTRETIEAERTAIRILRDQGKIHNEVFHAILQELDIEDMRLMTHRL